MRRAALWTLASVAFFAVLVLVWHVIASAQLVSPVFLPSPARVAAALERGFLKDTLYAEFLQTVGRMAVGWLFASILAIAAGTLISMSGSLKRYLTPTLEFLRPLPAPATIPLFATMLGLNEQMIITVISFGAIWPTLLATIHGFGAVDRRLYEVGGALGLSRLSFVLKIALPSAAPDILSGMRLSLTIALILTVVCEMIAGTGGLGYWILNYGRLFRADSLFAGVILLGLIGLTANFFMSRVEIFILRWRIAH